jgi:membrane-associated phospholipid phosphatase
MPPPSSAEATALARAVGAHALEAFLLLLALLLLAVGLLAWSARRFARRRSGRGGHPLARLALRLGLAFALIVGAGYVFAAIAAEIADGESLARIDQAFSDAVRSSTSATALQVFGWVTHLGDPATLFALCVVVALVLLARGERLLALAYIAAVGGNALLNPALKGVFERVRPLRANGQPWAEGFSFPSGHSSGSLVAYGMLAYVLMCTLPRGAHLPAVLLAAAAAFSVGASRVFLQAHFASDVAAGFASGTAWLVACIVSAEWARGRRG